MIQSYPFTALVGQENMKLALILAVINPGLGGVLIRGEKGTAKSTAVRALAALLPEQKIVAECQFGCDPDNRDFWCDVCKCRESITVKSRKRHLVELPIGATEDRLLGSINLEEAITKGESKFEPGLLAEANRGLLYVDEVNLLDDHLVDSLLDAAAMGRNIVEREGVSVSHPARFTLIGTMNPEEGELRPQLLDRFGLCVEVRGLEDPGQRREVVKRRLAFESSPEDFVREYKPEEEALGRRIEEAGRRLATVALADEALNYAVRICLSLGVDGHRGDLTVIKTALTLAAWKGKSGPDEDDVIEAAELALPHRMRRKPFQDVDFDVKGRLAEC
ncbi:magnesium chelatase ATPase subunit I [Deltaproteobacteria bacterium Smac51]|nr:magnesium chelatase ATPase subunit I [Deltaproteobacteria bacterium Smac51]